MEQAAFSAAQPSRTRKFDIKLHLGSSDEFVTDRASVGTFISLVYQNGQEDLLFGLKRDSCVYYGLFARIRVGIVVP